MKKYTDIPRFGHSSTIDYFTQVLSKGHKIIISLKMDGSNGQFERLENDELGIYSRETVLNEEQNLNGFYQYVKEKVDPTKLPKNMKIFGEWLVKHKVLYPKDAYFKFYLFDVFNTETQTYIDPNSKEYREIANYLISVGMIEAPVLYEGPYKGIHHIERILADVTRDDDEYKGQTPETLDDVFHEGIVVKSYDYRNHYGNQLFVKMVGNKFKEIKEKVKQPSGPDTSIEKQIADFAVTEARVEKTLLKLVDEGVLRSDFDLDDMPIIARNVPKRVFDDIMKEELDTIKETFGEFDDKVIGKKIQSATMNIVKEIIRVKVEERINSLK